MKTKSKKIPAKKFRCAACDKLKSDNSLCYVAISETNVGVCSSCLVIVNNLNELADYIEETECESCRS